MREANIRINAETAKAEQNLQNLGNQADHTSQQMLGVGDTAFTVAETITGSFAIAVGAIGLFAGENEKMQKIAVKANSVIAIALGVRQLAEQKVNIQILANTAATKLNAIANRATAATMRALGMAVNTTTLSFKAMKTALITTGVGALVVGLGFAIEAMMKWRTKNEDVGDGIDTNTEKIAFQLATLNELGNLNIALMLSENKFASQVILTTNSLENKKTVLEELNAKLAESIVLNGEDSKKTQELTQKREEAKQAIVDSTLLLEEQTLALQRYINFEENGAEAIAAARESNGESAKMMFDSIAGLMKEGSKEQKAYALASIATDTAMAISTMMGGSEKAAQGLASPFTGTPAYPIILTAGKIAFYASGISRILANVAQAKAILQGGSAGGISAGGGGGGTTYTAPFIPESAEQEGIIPPTGGGGQAVQAYVISSQLTNQQAIDQELELQSTL